MRVKSIKSVGRADVYNMEVDGTHDYVVNGGVVVHNCRYLLMMNPISPRRNVLQTPPKEDPLDIYRDKVQRDPTLFYRI